MGPGTPFPCGTHVWRDFYLVRGCAIYLLCTSTTVAANAETLSCTKRLKYEHPLSCKSHVNFRCGDSQCYINSSTLWTPPDLLHAPPCRLPIRLLLISRATLPRTINGEQPGPTTSMRTGWRTRPNAMPRRNSPFRRRRPTPCLPGSPGIFSLSSLTAVLSSPSHPANRSLNNSHRRIGTEVLPTTWSFRLAS